MNEEFQLKLQAYLDGELPGKEARKVEAILASDTEAQALLVELKNTNVALSVFEQEAKLPESREFFWSKLHREIRAMEAKLERGETTASWLEVFFARRVLVPVGVLATVVLAGFLTVYQTGVLSKNGNLSQGIEIAMIDPGTVTYRDYQEGMTVVWLSYPAENEFTETESPDTLQ